MLFETLKRLYLDDKLTQAGLFAAVKKGWITDAQLGEIVSPE